LVLVISKNLKEELIVFMKERIDKEHFLEPWLYSKTSYITKKSQTRIDGFHQRIGKELC
jgi:hypothetical protein